MNAYVGGTLWRFELFEHLTRFLITFCSLTLNINFLLTTSADHQE